ncbi:DNA repair protein RecN [Candidatus Persebacteraceae bacterium Df01]|uniref:DNA repair protein RecN n=1 Tax=Candidatus Doriopsillibacter californiensis TaxID=2970740 RepID=A0ABT7QMI6_9GAMM|nr:DNA repair protein RecN [Candidatus Persebacteraceae bacterium Df01]
MLLRLALRRFVVIEEVQIDFATGFCVLTGETGAGKSLLVDALALLAGGRMTGSRIMPGADAAEVEAVFDVVECPTLVQWLEDNALPADEEFVVRRVLSAQKSRAFINGRQVPLTVAADAVSQLVDICGQHAHYSLRKAAAHRELLDSCAHADDEIASVQQAHRLWSSANETLSAAQKSAADIQRQQAVLEEEIAELDALHFSLERWELESAQLTRLEHVADLAVGCAQAQQALEGDDGAEHGLVQAQRALESLRRLDDALSEPLECLEQALVASNEAVRALSAYADQLQPDPAAQEAADTFIAAAHRLARKYQLAAPTQLEELLNAKKAQAAQGAAADIEVLTAKEQRTRKGLLAASRRLSGKRKRAAEKLEESVSIMLPQLAMPEARLTVQLTSLDFPDVHGGERVELLINTRKNAVPAPIAEVASGGELSRLGLALQIAAGRERPRPIAVFDEVDGGIGGATAAVVGKMLQTLGESRQVLCVTHLAQVAACAAHHWRVRTVDIRGIRGVEIQKLSTGEREEELARIVGGAVITDEARANAADLLRQAQY